MTTENKTSHPPATGKTTDSATAVAEPPTIDPAKAARDRKMLAELDAHDLRREGSFVTQANGSGIVHYMPPNPPPSTASDSVLASQGQLDPSKADAMIQDEEKFQRPGFVDQLKKRLQDEVEGRKQQLKSQIDDLQKQLDDLEKSGSGDGGTSTAHAPKGRPQ